MADDADRGRSGRDAGHAVARLAGLTSAERSRLPPEALEAFSSDVVTLLSSRLARHEGPFADGPSVTDFETFVHALLHDDLARAAAHIEAQRSEGMSLRTIYLAYLARAARRLGELWDRDRIDFLQVTLAIGRLYAVLRGLRQPSPQCPSNSPRHALFMTLPGDDHHLGAAITTELFRLRGWEIQLESPVDESDAIATLLRSDHTVVAVSASRPRQLGELVRLVLALRFCRPQAFVLVSGHIVEEVPNLLELVDADAQAFTAPEAVECLETLVANQRRWGAGERRS